MITDSPTEFLRAFADLPADQPACAKAAFLVSPSGFGLSSESARDNRYMRLDAPADRVAALLEHAALASALREDLPVITFPGDPDQPDGVFPNNVFATAPGRLVVGRMCHPVRQRETGREDIRAFFAAMGYQPFDLSARADLVAELTGSLIIDRARGIGFAGLSDRCDAAGARAMHEAFGLKLTFCFDLTPGEYHTNVVMTLLASRGAILAADGFADPAVVEAIGEAYGGNAVRLSQAQKESFAGNAITLSERRVWMSASGADSLTGEQRAQFAEFGFEVGAVALPEIEKAGGSLRCCVSEIY